MHSSGELKTWITVVALVCLATGFAVGMAMPRVYASMYPDPGPLHLQRMQEVYGLTADQIRVMKKVLMDKELRIMAFVVSAGQLPPEMDAHIKMINRQADDRIEAVLDSRQREQYRKDKQHEPSQPKRRERNPKKK